MTSCSRCCRPPSGCAGRLPDKIARLGNELGRLTALAAVGDICQFGLAAGIELVADRTEKTPFPPGQRTGMRVCHAARRHGGFLRPLGDTIICMPPLSITDREITHLVDAIAFGIRETCS